LFSSRPPLSLFPQSPPSDKLPFFLTQCFFVRAGLIIPHRTAPPPTRSEVRYGSVRCPPPYPPFLFPRRQIRYTVLPAAVTAFQTVSHPRAVARRHVGPPPPKSGERVEIFPLPPAARSVGLMTPSSHPRRLRFHTFSVSGLSVSLLLFYFQFFFSLSFLRPIETNAYDAELTGEAVPGFLHEQRRYLALTPFSFLSSVVPRVTRKATS